MYAGFTHIKRPSAIYMSNKSKCKVPPIKRLSIKLRELQEPAPLPVWTTGHSPKTQPVSHLQATILNTVTMKAFLCALVVLSSCVGTYTFDFSYLKGRYYLGDVVSMLTLFESRHTVNNQPVNVSAQCGVLVKKNV